MRTSKGNNLSETKRLNRALIKNLIFRSKNITRTDIAHELALTLPTITTTINEMLKEGILKELPFEGSKMGGAGRRPTYITFQADMAYAVGVELGPYFCSLVLLNMAGEILIQKIIDSPHEKYEDMVQEISTHILALITEYPRSKILGIGIGLPGFIKYQKGTIITNPRKDWNLKPLAKDIEYATGLTTIIDNNVRIRASAFELHKIQVTNKPIAYLYTSKGVACPIIVRYGIISGNNAGAGELGATLLQVGGNDGDFKIVDDLAGYKAIFESCQRYMLDGKLQSLKKILEKKSFFDIQDIIQLQESGDKEIEEIVYQSIQYLGIALSNVVNLINPKFVIVDSYIMKLQKNQAKLKECAKKFFFGVNEEEVTFIFHPYDPVWGANAAALFVISNLYLDA